MPAVSESVSIQFTLRNPATKVVCGADSTPTAVFVRNGDDTSVTCTVSNVTTGVYKVTVTIPATYVTGDEIALRVTATVAGTTDSRVFDLGEVEPRGAATVASTSTDWTVNLTTARDNLSIRLAEISANPKPDYSVNGQSFSWLAYYNYLLQQIKEIDDLLVSREAPYEIHSAAM
jgi:hypothetical protein